MLAVERTVRDFYEGQGWRNEESSATYDATLWEDLRPVAAPYVRACRRRVRRHLYGGTRTSYG
jgi:hypothetical protein